MSAALAKRIAASLSAPVSPDVREFAEHLARKADAVAVLFYGSNLRTGSLEGVLDYYVLTDGRPERGIWPRVSYHEREFAGVTLRAKVATMTLARFREAADGTLLDTTIWARFVQPSALVHARPGETEKQVVDAVGAACRTAARLAVALGPPEGTAETYWQTLFEATYRAEFRIETASRAKSIIEVNAGHFDGLLPLALDAAGIDFERNGKRLSPHMAQGERLRVRRWWRKRRRMGKPLNLARLVRAASTFEGAARYGAWKVERHSGVPVKLTPWREKHPVLAAPGVLFSVWRERRRRMRNR